jgi:hypothetical protein
MDSSVTLVAKETGQTTTVIANDFTLLILQTIFISVTVLGQFTKSLLSLENFQIVLFSRFGEGSVGLGWTG